MNAAKSILFICPYPQGQSPSQRFRFEQYFDVLNSNGFYYEVYPFLTFSVWQILYLKGNVLKKTAGLIGGFSRRFIQLFLLHKFDFIFIHREATPIGPPWFEWAAAKIFRRKIIYDFDDAIWLPNTSSENNIVSKLKWHSKVRSVCRWSYAVSCGNEYLCDFARHYNSRVFFNPTTIDTNHLHNPDLYTKKLKSDQVVIGWTGTHSTLPYLDSIVSVIQSLERKIPGQFRFVIIADKKPSFQISSLEFIPWSKQTEIKDLIQFDIGIMPLQDDRWAKGKCGFKALQYMALKIPAIVSPVGVNRTLVDHTVNGFHVFTEADWLNFLEALVRDESMREKMGEAGREKVIKHYSVSSNTSAFLSLFS